MIPHDASNPHQLRTGIMSRSPIGTVVTNAGAGGFCMECHNSRNGSVTNSMVKYPLCPTDVELAGPLLARMTARRATCSKA